MKCVVAIALLAVGALSLAISAAIFIERNQTSTQPLAELHQCGISMCLLDIEAGKTPIMEAEATLKSSTEFTIVTDGPSPSFQRYYPFYRVDLQTGTQGCHNLYTCVIEIRMVIPLGYESISAGQIVSEFGPPCGIVPGNIRDATVLIYPSMILYFMSDVPSTGKRFQPMLLLEQINVFNKAVSCEQVTVGISDYYHWRGFTIYSQEVP